MRVRTDVLEGRAGLFERLLDVLERLHRLQPGVPFADQCAVGVGGGRPRDVHDLADPHRARVADQGSHFVPLAMFSRVAMGELAKR